MVPEAILDLFHRTKMPSGTMTRRQRGRDAIPKNALSQENHVNPWSLDLLETILVPPALTFCSVVSSAFKGGSAYGGITIKVIICTFGCGFSNGEHSPNYWLPLLCSALTSP